MFPLRRSAFVFAGLLLTSCACLSAQVGMPLNHTDPKLEPATVRELVARYCRMDYAGARLGSTDWPKIAPLVAWQSNPDFPLFMVASRFDVGSDLGFEHGKYEVDVKYHIVGKYDLAEGYSEEPGVQVEEVHFTVAEVNGDWRITAMEPNYPHPSRTAALQWVNQKMAGTTDAVSKTIYQHAIDLLKPQNATPVAK